MVNADRVKRKLPSLLCDDDTSQRRNANELMRYRYRLMQFKKRKPQRFSSLTNELVAVLEEIDRELQGRIASNANST